MLKLIQKRLEIRGFTFWVMNMEKSGMKFKFEKPHVV